MNSFLNIASKFWAETIDSCHLSRKPSVNIDNKLQLSTKNGSNSNDKFSSIMNQKKSAESLSLNFKQNNLPAQDYSSPQFYNNEFSDYFNQTPPKKKSEQFLENNFYSQDNSLKQSLTQNSSLHSDFSISKTISQNSLSSPMFADLKSRKYKPKNCKIWTLEEDEILKKAYFLNSGKNWKNIAKMVPGRSHTQCSQRWRRIQPHKSRQPWTKDEDKLLMGLSDKYGLNWSLIASFIEGRTGKQVRERYYNKLDPAINRNKFTSAEDEKIIELFTEYGSKWLLISKHFQGRPENMIKNRFYSHIRKKILLADTDKYKDVLEKIYNENNVNRDKEKENENEMELEKEEIYMDNSKKEEYLEHDLTYQHNKSSLEEEFDCTDLLLPSDIKKEIQNFEKNYLNLDHEDHKKEFPFFPDENLNSYSYFQPNLNENLNFETFMNNNDINFNLQKINEMKKIINSYLENNEKNSRNATVEQRNSMNSHIEYLKKKSEFLEFMLGNLMGQLGKIK